MNQTTPSPHPHLTHTAERTFVALGAANAFIAIAAGAFGAHALRARVSADSLEVWRTAAHYHLIHAVAMILIALLAAQCGRVRSLMRCGWLMQAGIVLFSGSLYLLVLTGAKWLGAITPLGGVCFLAAWALLAAVSLRR